MVLVCKCGKCWLGRKIPHLNALHGGGAEGFFGDQLRSPKYGVGVETGVLFSSFGGSVKMWGRCVVEAYTVVWEHAATALVLQTR